MANNITEEILSIILRVVDIQAGKYKIIGCDIDDIKQEAFIICMEALPRWDNERPLENFLAVNLSNRLKSLVRDKYKLQGRFADITKRVLGAVDIDSVNWDMEKSLTSTDDVYENVELRDIEATIDRYLPISLRKDYLRMKAGIKIHRGRAKKIRDFIQALIKELT